MLIKNIENDNSKKEKLIVTFNTKLIERGSAIKK